MGIVEIIGLFFSIVLAVAPTLLAHIVEKSKEHNEFKKTAFDLGLSELDAADRRMRLDVDQHHNLTLQPRGSATDIKR
ncbi:MAG: hypothetical protein KGL39_18685 [Patescibacteria group bacterium]|nr:hypothetical protein [Patescibacteria group bacterium]